MSSSAPLSGERRKEGEGGTRTVRKEKLGGKLPSSPGLFPFFGMLRDPPLNCGKLIGNQVTRIENKKKNARERLSKILLYSFHFCWTFICLVDQQQWFISRAHLSLLLTWITPCVWCLFFGCHQRGAFQILFGGLFPPKGYPPITPENRYFQYRKHNFQYVLFKIQPFLVHFQLNSIHFQPYLMQKRHFQPFLLKFLWVKVADFP